MDEANPPTRAEMELRHLRRDSRTALELSILTGAPTDLVERLAIVSGLLEALSDLPLGNARVSALASSTAERARGAVADWREWEAAHKALA